MQRSREDDPKPPVVSSVVLRFPTIPVHGTPENWLSQSQLVTMNINHDDSCDDTSSSLGDSAYEFIDERSNASTDYEDQDAMTASTTSSDEHGFDQVDVQHQQTIPGEQPNQPSQDQDSTSPNKHGPSESEHYPSDQPPEEQDTLENTLMDPHDPQESIQFDEPSVINLNASSFLEVSHTLQVIGKHERSNAYYDKLMECLPGQLVVTVEQTMTTHSLTPEGGSYKILYVGPSKSREPIVQKIGTALAASLKCSTPDLENSPPSKFNIVPISGFGEAASPEVVLIDSSGLELNVEECHHASLTRQESGNDTLHLEMADGRHVESRWTGTKFALSGDWKLPDIAIFCLPEDESLEFKQTRQFARSLMSRHAVQSVIITQARQWDRQTKEQTNLDVLTPHICLKSRPSSLGPAQIIKRFPIDLATFLSIDPGQMNRNLECLAVAQSISRARSPALGDKRSMHDADNTQSPLLGFLGSYISGSQREILKSLKRYERPMSVLALCLVSLIPMIVAIGLSGMLGASKVSNSRIFPTMAVSTTTLASTQPNFARLSTLAARTAQTTPTQVSPMRSLSTNTDIASFLLGDSYVLAPNKSDHFKIHVLGDCHIVLRPPHWFSKLRKPPKLSFKVLRGETELEHELMTLFDGVYALQIPHEDAYGLLNVSIWTIAKPEISESFEVDFGSSWLKVAGWKKATRALIESLRNDLDSVQTGLSTVYDQIRTGLSSFVQQQRQKVKAQKEAERAIIKSHYKTAVKAKEIFVAKTRNLARDLKMKIREGNSIMSQMIKARSKQFSKDISLYTRNRTSNFSRQARLFAKATTGVNVKALVQGVGDFRRKQLREAQKNALKTWWKIGGVPKQQRMKVKAKATARSRKRGVSSGDEM